MLEMKERKHGVANRTLLVGWSGWKLAIMRCEIMVKSDKHLARLMCFGVRLDMEKEVHELCCNCSCYLSRL